jgi:Flp pilus assembly CpaF family ATPase
VEADVAAIPGSVIRLFEALAELLTDPALRRVVVEPSGRVRVTRLGRTYALPTPVDPAVILTGAEGLARRANKPFDESSPSLEAQLKDGTRFVALRPPTIDAGVALSITRPGGRDADLAALEADTFIEAHAAALLTQAVEAGANIAVVGPPDSGRTSLLEALCRATPPAASLGVVDEPGELHLPGVCVTRLNPRRSEREAAAGSGGLADALYFASRMAFDRVALNDPKWSDACELVHHLASRGVPTLLVWPGAEARDAMLRLEALGRATTAGPRERAIPGLLCAGLDLVVTTARSPNGPYVRAIDRVERGADGLPALIGQYRRSAPPSRFVEALPSSDDDERTLISEAAVAQVAPDAARSPSRSFSQILASIGTHSVDGDDPEPSGAWSAPTSVGELPRDPAQETRETELPTPYRRA